MKLTYRAYDRSGKEVSDVIEAANAADATDALRQRGLYVIEVSRQADSPRGGRRRGRRGMGRGSQLKELALFTRQLCVLVSSGTPLVQSLSALERQTKAGPWHDAIAAIRKRIEEGSSMAEAMSEFPEYFDTIYCSLITAGESAGKLGSMLERLARLTQKRMQVRNSILGALTYPCLLVVVAVSVLVLLLAFMIPRFATLFETLDVPLPTSTKVLIVLSNGLRAYWWAVVAFIVGGGVAARLWLASPAGKRAVDTIALRLPQVGRIIRNFATARITRLLGVMLNSSVPVLEALRLTRAGVRNVHYAELMANAEEAVTHGESISFAFSQSDLISPSVSEAIKSGEQSGRVGPLLLTIADFLDEENEVVVRSLTNILEPAILVVMGVLVGLVAISMFMPLFDLTAMT